MKNRITDIVGHTLGHKGFDYDQITDQVFIGTNMCCEFGFAKELLTKKVRADISLEEARIDSPRGVDYFLWLPTVDNTAPSLDKLVLGVRTLEFFISRKIRVYIHCEKGHGRAPTLFAAYLIKQGMSLGAALKFLKSKRPVIHLNRLQREALRAYKQSLKA